MIKAAIVGCGKIADAHAWGIFDTRCTRKEIYFFISFINFFDRTFPLIIFIIAFANSKFLEGMKCESGR